MSQEAFHFLIVDKKTCHLSGRDYEKSKPKLTTWNVDVGQMREVRWDDWGRSIMGGM
jgi:hypothetical protein